MYKKLFQTVREIFSVVTIQIKNIPVNQWHFQKVKCSSDYYYIYDRPYLKKDTITNKRVLVIVRNIGKASDFDNQYKTMKYISYTFTFVIAFIGFLLIGIVSSRLTIPMKKIKDTADKIGTDGDLAKRIEYTTPFKELDAMIQANNRMMDRLEDLFKTNFKNIKKWEWDSRHMCEDIIRVLGNTTISLRKENEDMQQHILELEKAIELQNENISTLKTKLKHPVRTLFQKVADSTH